MANLKGGNAVVRFLLAHGEKVGIAAIAACVGLLFWSAIKHDSLGPEEQPDRLGQLATQASQHIQKFTWEDLDPNSKVIAEPVRGGAMKPIVSEHFPRIEEPWTRPVLDPMSLRTDPELLAAEDLEVHGDSGLWAFADPDIIEQKRMDAMNEQMRRQREEEANRAKEGEDERGGRPGRGGGLFGEGRRGERDRAAAPARRDGPVVVSANTRSQLEGFEQITAKSWVTVVAKVPIEKQSKLYDEALMNSTGFDPSRDAPVYRGYVVQRAEVTDDGLGEWQEIARLDQRRLDKATDYYPFIPEDLVSQRYSHPLLTHPLPSLILRDWDKRVTHSEIPLAAEEEAAEMIEPEELEEGGEPGEGENMFGARPQDREERFAGERRVGGPRATRRNFPRHPAMERGMEGGEMLGERGGRSYSRSGDRGSYSWDGVTPYVLFRYFDDGDGVEPGHRYRYRVQLALADVNHEVPEQYLDKAVTERRREMEPSQRRLRWTEWSEPSPIASVPLPARVYLVSADPARPNNFYDEPEAEILVQAFNSELPAEIALEESFLRGSVLNVHEKASVIWVNRTDLPEGKQDEEFDFRTGITVIDFRGGDQLNSRNRDLTAPAEAVLMDPAGRLFLQSELDDQASVASYQQALDGGADGRRPFGGRGGREDFFEGMEGAER